MHVVYLHQHFTTPDGASGTRSYEMARALVNRGHSVTILCGSYQAGKTGLNVPFHKGVRRGTVDGFDVVEFDTAYANALSLPARVKVFLTYAIKSINFIRKEHYDLLFASSAPLTAGLPGIWMRMVRRDKRPFVFEIRDPWPEAPKAMGLKNPIALMVMETIESLSYKAANGWVALSPGMVETFARKGVPKERIALVPNAADIDVFTPSVEKHIASNRASESEVVFVYPGTHGIANGLDQVIDACSILQERGLDYIRIWLIGEGKLKQKLRQRAESLRLKNIIFSDPISKTQLAVELPRTDVGLMILDDISVFRYGSSPNKFFDYISAGIPVIVNHPGWVADLIEANDCGLVASPRDPVSLANAIQDMALRCNRAEMGKRARALAEREFSRKLLTDRLVTYLEEVHHSSERKAER